MSHLYKRKVKLFLKLELSRLWKARKCIFGVCGWKTTTPRMHLLHCPMRPRLPVTNVVV